MVESPTNEKKSKLPWEVKVDRNRPYRPMPQELDDREAKERARAHKKYQADRDKSGLAALDKEASLTATLASKKAHKLANELQIMRALEPQTIDGEYTCKFSAWESAIAAGPRGATSGGLRDLGPLQFWKILQRGSDEGNTKKLQAKLDEAVKAAGDIKLIPPDAKGAVGKQKYGSVQKIESQTIHKITAEMSEVEKQEKMRLRQELEEQRTMARQINEFLKAQRARNPLRDRRKFEDTTNHHHGPAMGGWGAL